MRMRMKVVWGSKQATNQVVVVVVVGWSIASIAFASWCCVLDQQSHTVRKVAFGSCAKTLLRHYASRMQEKTAAHAVGNSVGVFPKRKVDACSLHAHKNNSNNKTTLLHLPFSTCTAATTPMGEYAVAVSACRARYWW